MKKRTFTMLVSFFILHVSSIIALAASVPLQTGQTKCYTLSGSEFPCVGTGQDGELKPGLAWPDPRFTDNTDGTITDNLTGIIWMQNMQTAGPTEGFAGLNCTKGGTSVNWQEALDHLKCLNTYSYLGFNDWRLPTVAELASIVTYDVADQHNWLSSSGFMIPSIAGSSGKYYYWSSTTRTDNSGNAFAMEKISGNVVDKLKTCRYYGVDEQCNYNYGYQCGGYPCTFLLAWPVRDNM